MKTEFQGRLGGLGTFGTILGLLLWGRFGRFGAGLHLLILEVIDGGCGCG